jgi:hypothetical protein
MTVFVNHIVILIPKDVLLAQSIQDLIQINQDVSVLIHLAYVFQLYPIAHKVWKEHQMEFVSVEMVIYKLEDVDQILNVL